VADSEGVPLAGVNVSVKGGSVATITNTQGDYTIKVNDTETLVFTFLGYNTQELPVNGRTAINVIMELSRQSLDEVVVTALGVTKEKKSLGYSVTEVRGEEFTEARSNNVAQSLTGKIAGLDATQINSGPGGSSRVIIRGSTSLNNNQQPLYVINGLAIDNWSYGAVGGGGDFNVDRGDGIASINPDDIESISVLKGGAAAALYGSQAANGVILITTKSGKAQKGIGVEINSNTVIGPINEFPHYQYVYGQGLSHSKPASQGEAIASGHLGFGAKMDGTPVVQFDGVLRPYSPISVKENFKNFFNNSVDATNSLAFSGGNPGTQFRISLSDLRSTALQPKSTYKRQTANLAVNTKMGKNNFIEIESNMQYNFENGKNRPNIGYEDLNAAWGVWMLPANVDIRSLAPGYDLVTGDETQWNQWSNAPNPYYVINKLGNGDKRQRIIGQGKIKFNLLKNLFIQGQISRDFSYTKDYNYVPAGDAWTPLGYMVSSYDQRDKTVSQVNMNYNAVFLKNFHVLAMVGGSQERFFSNGSNASGSQFIIPNFISLTNLNIINPANESERKNGTNSVFGSADFDYKGFLFLNFTGREDWFSTLNPGFRNIFYPSIGTSFLLSEAAKLPEVFSSVKLRASWAQVGSATVGAGAVNTTYSISSQNVYGVPTQSNSSSLENPFIKPLTVTTSEGGVEVQLLRSRLGVDVTYYSKVTTNDILSPPISSFSGFTAGNQNLGKMTNHGVELALNGTPIRKADLSWDVNFNGSWNQSRIVSLAPGITVQSLGSGIVNAVGLPYGSIVQTNYLKDANGVQVYNKTSHYPVNFRDTLGVANPPWLMGLSNEFRYKKFSLNVLLDAKFGAKAFSGQKRYAFRSGLALETLEDRETGPHLVGVDQNGAPFDYQWKPELLSTYDNQIGNSFTANSTFSTDFVKLRSIVFNYTLPVEKWTALKLQAATLSLVAKNLAILFQGSRIKSSGLDPELAESTSNVQGFVGTKMPITRQLGLNLTVKF
jgi:TonB-linked SusC/RagA family outer membrane protein